MATLLRIGGTVSWSATADSQRPGVAGRATIIASPAATQPDVTGTITYAAVNAFANPGSKQVVYWEVLVNGAVVPQRQILSLDVTRSRGELAQATVVLARRSTGGSAVYDYPDPGYITQFKSPVPGKKNVTIRCVYANADGTRSTFALVTNGLAESTTENAEGNDRTILTLVGPGGRYDRQRVDFSAPPGHGETRGRIVQRVCDEVPVTDTNLHTTKVANKAVELLDEQWLGWAREYLWTEGRYAQWDRGGTFEAPVFGPESGRARDWTIDEADINVEVGVGLDAPGDVPTTVRVTGTRQIVEECGDITEVTVANSFGTYQPRLMFDRQDSFGDIESLSGGPAGSGFPNDYPSGTHICIGRTETFVTKRCDREILKRVKVYGWFNPRTWRYVIDDDEAITGYNTAGFLELGAAKDDDQEMYRWHRERWVLLSETIIVPYYDDDGYLIEEGTFESSWQLRKKALRERSAANVAWDDTANATVVGPNRVLADGTPAYTNTSSPFGDIGVEFFPSGRFAYVAGGNPYLLWVNGPGPPTPNNPMLDSHSIKYPGPVPGFRAYRETGSPDDGPVDNWYSSWTAKRYVHDENGNLIRDEQKFRTWRRKEGTTKLYRDGDTGSQDQDHVALEEEVIVAYAARGDSAHDRFTTRKVTGENPTFDAEFGLSGYLPAAPRDTSVAASDDYPDSIGTSRTATQEMSVECTSNYLLAHHVARIDELNMPWAEDEAELDAGCLRHLREESAIRVEIPLRGCNALVDVGHRALVRFRRLRLNHDVYFHTVRWSFTPAQGSKTTISALLYVI